MNSISRVFRLVLLLLAAISPLFASARAAETNSPIVLLKLDDLVRHGRGLEATVSPRWQRVTDFLEGEKIKASFGLLADSLDTNCPAYVAWIKTRVTNGWIEIWHHGYFAKGLPESMKVGDRTAEYLGGSVEDQAAMFRKSLQLAKEKVDIEMIAFGPHSTAIDARTYQALETIPQINMVWFYGPTNGVPTSKFVVQRLFELERPLFVPNPTALKQRFEERRSTAPYVALQGHPNQWDDERFENFKKAVLYLREQGCRFMTPTEFLRFKQSQPKVR